MSNPYDKIAWKPWKLKDLALPIDTKSETDVDIILQQVVEQKPTDQFLSIEAELESVKAETIHQAHETGFSEGKQKGYEAGYKEGFQEGIEKGINQGMQDSLQQQQPLLEQMKQMISNFQQTLDFMDSAIPARLIQLSLTVAKQIIGKAPLCDSTALQKQILQLIQQEPMFGEKTQLHVHPSDLEWIKSALGSTLEQNGWCLLADNQLHPGGCTINSEKGDFDASLATRWHELCHLAAPGKL